MIMTVEPGNAHLPAYSRGSIQNPRKWWKITTGSMNQYIFSQFIEDVCTDIERRPVPGGFDEEKYFMWDNCAIHKTAMVTASLELREERDLYRFRSICRPPYQPKIAPIEYIFGEITMILSRKCAKDWDLGKLSEEIHNACMMVGCHGKLDRTYQHCGYNY